MGHQADPAQCYKFHILQKNLQYAIFTILFWDCGRRLIARVDSLQHTHSPPRVRLVLSAFGHLFQGPASHLTVLRTIWIEWTRSVQSPWLTEKSPVKVSLGWLTLYYLLPICCIFCILTCFLSFIQSAFNSNTLFSNLQFSSNCSIIVPLISDYCSIIVLYSDPQNVFQVFQCRYQQLSTKSINIIQVQDLPTFVLA
jgi:hypothetical protein